MPLPRRCFGVNAVRLSPCIPLSGSPRLPSNSSLELSKELPLHRYHPRASSPGVEPTFIVSIPSTGRYHRTDTFRPRRFSRPRRLAPHGASQVYCTLQPIMGSTRFQSSSPLFERPTEVGPCSRSDRTEVLSSCAHATCFLRHIRGHTISSHAVSKSRA